jgi:hypothetical protein
MQRKLLPLALAAASLALAGCSDKSGTAPRTDGLSAAEVRALVPSMTGSVTGVARVPTGAWFSLSGSGARPAAAVNTVSVSFDQTAPCPRGGTVRAAGHVGVSYDPVTRDGSLDVTATTTPAACAYDGDAGAVISLTGNPSLQLHATAAARAGVPGKVTVSQTGGFNWSRSTGGSGSCTLDLTTVVDPATQTTVTTGTFCGIAVNVTTTAHS